METGILANEIYSAQREIKSHEIEMIENWHLNRTIESMKGEILPEDQNVLFGAAFARDANGADHLTRLGRYEVMLEGRLTKMLLELQKSHVQKYRVGKKIMLLESEVHEDIKRFNLRLIHGKSSIR